MSSIRDKILGLVREYDGLQRGVILTLLADPGRVFEVETELDEMLRCGELVEKNGEYRGKNNL